MKITPRHILLTMSGVGIIALLTYIYYYKKGGQFPTKEFFITLSVAIGISLAVIVIVYFVISYFTRDNEEPMEGFKDIVSIQRAIDVWKEACILRTNIPHIKQTWKDDSPIIPINPYAITVRNETSHTDPLFQTPDRFITFNARISEGDRRGMHTFTIRHDLGEQWIRDNWNARVKDNSGFVHQTNLQAHRLPLTSSKEFQERAHMHALTLAAEGYTQKEISEELQPFLGASTVPSPVVQIVREPIKSPDVPDLSEDSEEIIGEESIEEDIKRYRRKKR